MTGSQNSILITGASSGIGKATAIYLARESYTVLATVRREPDVKALNDLGIQNLKPIFPVDLTKQDQILAATGSVKRMIRERQIPPLWAIINIAGGGSITPVEMMDIYAYRNELEKRLVAPVILIQELLPLLRETHGRILWIATPGLFPVPYVTDIHAPDFAVNFLARTLNLELLPDGIKNILVRCGGINTPSVHRSEIELEEKLKNLPPGMAGLYQNRLQKVLSQNQKFDLNRTESVDVAKLIAKILATKNPKTRYHIGKMSGLGAFLEKLPQSWVDFIMKKREIKNI